LKKVFQSRRSEPGAEASEAVAVDEWGEVAVEACLTTVEVGLNVTLRLGICTRRLGADGVVLVPVHVVVL
tara:strand:- start:339 stop:548 length:210 start_codon:yes stop_codon:yes gene_type:complete